MKKYPYLLTAILLFFFTAASAQNKTDVGHFEKVIISQHVQATFVESATEYVEVEECKVDRGKLHIEVEGKTLRVYLEGAKDIEKSERNGRSPYSGTIVKATVHYKTLNDLSIRGEETQLLKSPIKGGLFKLRIYGESKVTFNRVELQNIETTIYGESTLSFLSGSIASQKHTCYGESTINSLAIQGKTARLTALGEAEFKMNVSDNILIRAMGEARLQYKGNPTIDKGLHIGDLHITRIK